MRFLMIIRMAMISSPRVHSSSESQKGRTLGSMGVLLTTGWEKINNILCWNKKVRGPIVNNLLQLEGLGLNLKNI